MRYGSLDPYGPKTYGPYISLLQEGTMRYGSFDPYGPKTYGVASHYYITAQCVIASHAGTSSPKNACVGG